jgi:hypothetical protein
VPEFVRILQSLETVNRVSKKHLDMRVLAENAWVAATMARRWIVPPLSACPTERQ